MVMNIESTAATSVIPSHLAAVLRQTVGRRIVSATRYSWWAPAEAERQCKVPMSDLFSLTAGPAAIEFDSGLILGIASDPAQDSVIVWIEKNEAGQEIASTPLSSDNDLHPISASDPIFANRFWHQVIGAKVVSISILVRKTQSARLAELPNEVGLSFLLDSGEKVIATHGLHDDSDDFSIISDRSITDAIRGDLEELPVATK